jgi:hypothetical protein
MQQGSGGSRVAKISRLRYQVNFAFKNICCASRYLRHCSLKFQPICPRFMLFGFISGVGRSFGDRSLD